MVTFYADRKDTIAKAMLSFYARKPVSFPLSTFSEGEDPVIKGVVISIKGDGPMYEIEVRG